MRNINLDDATIEYEGKWLTIKDLTQEIQKKIDSGEMKFAELAGALEELNQALENAQTLSIKLVLDKRDYETLKAKGQADDRTCLRKAIQAFISKEVTPLKDEFAETMVYNAIPKQLKKKVKIKCAGCGKPIPVDLDQEESEIQCGHCGARGLLKQRQME